MYYLSSNLGKSGSFAGAGPNQGSGEMRKIGISRTLDFGIGVEELVSEIYELENAKPGVLSTHWGESKLQVEI